MKFNLYAITVDIDWAPDFMIEYLINQFEKYQVKCTWFITHDTPVLKKLKSNPLFELGIHPNFFAGSTHGLDEDEVIEHCLDIVGDTKCVRMHALWQSSRLLRKLREKYHILIDSSIYLPQAGLMPHQVSFSHNEKPLIRIPYFWEDDFECYNPDKSWDADNPKYHVNGMKVFDFHPTYVFLNSDTMHDYEQLKVEKCLTKALHHIEFKDVKPYINEGEGNRNLFNGLLHYLNSKKIESFTLSEIASNL